jgi:phage gp16-like protein
MTDGRRKKLVRLVHTGKAKLGWDDEAYRAFLGGVCGKESAADMDVRELAAAVSAMRELGFAPPPGRVKPEEEGGAARAQLEYIKGMRAVCARNKNDAALTAFVRRIARVDALRFLTVETARKVILALREMMTKAGHDPGTSERL